jgi:hypothetical protein
VPDLAGARPGAEAVSVASVGAVEAESAGAPGSWLAGSWLAGVWCGRTVRGWADSRVGSVASGLVGRSPVVRMRCSAPRRHAAAE